MKLAKALLSIISCFFFLSSHVYAASLCSFEEQRIIEQESANIKASYDVIEYDRQTIIEDEDVTVKDYAIDISLLNITEDVYAVITNNINNEKQTINYSNTKNGIATYRWYEIGDITNFTITIYSSNDTGCPNESIRTISLITPRYNNFSKNAVCDELKDFYLCNEFVNFEPVNENTFYKKLDEFRIGKIDNNGEKNNNTPNKTNSLIDILNDYKWYIVGGALIIAVGASIILIKNIKKQRELGL